MSVSGKPKGVFHFLEARVEGLVNGLLGGSNKSQVQPVAVAHLLARHAEDDKLISLNQVYIPIRYLVFLNPEDMTALTPIRTELEAQFRQFLEEWAADRNYVPNGPISIEMQERGSIARGTITIVSSFSEDLAPEAEVEATGISRDAGDAVGALHVTEGEDAGSEFPILPRRMVLGRVGDCDIQLQDTNVSRQHAALVPDEDGWLVEDLGSTNGTLLNRQRVTRARLRDGDLLKLGGTVVRVSLAGAGNDEALSVGDEPLAPASRVGDNGRALLDLSQEDREHTPRADYAHSALGRNGG